MLNAASGDNLNCHDTKLFHAIMLFDHYKDVTFDINQKIES